MPRSSSVSDDVWAKAIHAVNVEKMSLRQAAQLYGVHHMSLHRRVRGRYPTATPPSFDIRAYLTPDDEAEVLGVLREQFLHEQRITSDDIRYVVRTIASHGGKRQLPPEFPPNRWIVNFKRVHGFAKLNHCAYPPMNNADSESEKSSGTMTATNNMGDSYYAVPRFQESRHRGHHHHQQQQQQDQLEHQQQMQVQDQEQAQQQAQAQVQLQQQIQAQNVQRQQQQDSEQNNSDDREDFGSTASSGSYENGETEKKTYRLSHTVSPETWEKAIAAVEKQGMSLRAAARVYGVHFAALHRRVKKRAQGDRTQAMEGYLHPDDEAGIVRVVIARAELGVLMSFDELMDLVQRTALRNLPNLSIEAARKLMSRFESRNEHAIRHIITDWPIARLSANVYASHSYSHSHSQSSSHSNSHCSSTASSSTSSSSTMSRMTMTRVPPPPAQAASLQTQLSSRNYSVREYPSPSAPAPTIVIPTERIEGSDLALDRGRRMVPQNGKGRSVAFI